MDSRSPTTQPPNTGLQNLSLSGFGFGCRISGSVFQGGKLPLGSNHENNASMDSETIVEHRNSNLSRVSKARDFPWSRTGEGPFLLRREEEAFCSGGRFQGGKHLVGLQNVPAGMDESTYKLEESTCHLAPLRLSQGRYGPSQRARRKMAVSFRSRQKAGAVGGWGRSPKATRQQVGKGQRVLGSNGARRE